MTGYHAVSRGLTAVLLVCGLAALFGAPPWWWLGAGALAAALSLARSSGALSEPWTALGVALTRRRRLRRLEFRWSTVLAELACIGLIVVVVATILGGSTLGDRPINGDHAVHYFKAFNFEHHLLSHGSIRGWSNLWYAGYPANYLYPFGADLFVVAVHGLSLGLLSFSNAYGLAIFLFWTLYGYSVYRLGAVSSGRLVGLAAALLAVTDPGGGRAGGWQQAVYVGVWPQTLAVAFATLALSRLPALLDRARYSHVAVFAALTGAALVTHPLVVFLYALALPLALLVRCGRLRRPWPLVAFRFAAAIGVGTLIASAYLIPFATLGNWMIPTGVAWDSASEFGAKLGGLEGIFGMPRVVLALGLFGTLAALGSRRLMLRLGAILVVVLSTFAAATLPNAFHLPTLLKGLYSVQYERYLILLKPFFFVLAAHAFFALPRALQTAPARIPRDRRGRIFSNVGLCAVTFISVTALAPLAVPFVRGVAGGLVRLERASSRPAARGQLVRWLESNLPRDGFYRLAVDMPSHAPFDLGTELEWPLYKLGGGPAVLFKYRMLGRSVPLLETLNVRYVLSDRAYRSSDFTLVKRIGPYYVYEFRKYRPEPFTVEGSGHVTLKHFGDDMIELVAGPGARGKLRLSVSYFPRWHATRDGKPIPIQASAFDREPFTGFMTVPLAPGHYRFEFRQSALDHLASALGITGIVLVFGIAALDRRWRPAVRCRRAIVRAAHWLVRCPRWMGWSAAGLLFSIILLTGPVLAAWTPRLQVGPEPIHQGSVRYDFGDHLARAHVEVGGIPCAWSFDGFQCGNLADTVSFGLDGVDGYLIRQCIRAKTTEGDLTIEYPHVPSGNELVGYVGVSSFSSTGARFRVMAGSRVLFQTRAIRRGEVTRFRAPLAADSSPIRFEMGGGRRDVVCFQAQVMAH